MWGWGGVRRRRRWWWWRWRRVVGVDGGVTWSTSNCTRPSMLISFDSRVPTCFDWNILSFIRVWKPFSRPRYGKPFSCLEPLLLSAAARSRRYGRSKLMMLYLQGEEGAG